MFKHALIEGFKNLTRSFWLSATAISVLTVSLGSVAFIATLSTSVGFTLRQLNNQLVITAFLNENVEPETINTAIEEFSRNENIKTVKYFDREAARNEILNDEDISAVGETLQNENIQFVDEFIEIVPEDIESYDAVNTLINSERYVNLWSSIEGSQEIRDALEEFYLYTNLGGLVIIVLFGLISILVMVNILRIAIYSHRDEIEIMRLVGATNSYIRGPFIAEGAYFNIIAAAIILAIFIPGVNVLLPWFEGFFQLDVNSTNETAALIWQMYLSVTLTIIVGVLTGLATAYLATQRYLKL